MNISLLSQKGTDMKKTPIDIVDIKNAVKDGQLKAYVKNGIIYLTNDIGECVEIGKVVTDNVTIKNGITS